VSLGSLTESTLSAGAPRRVRVDEGLLQGRQRIREQRAQPVPLRLRSRGARDRLVLECLEQLARRVDRLEQELGIRLPLASLLERTTAAALAPAAEELLLGELERELAAGG
jgi:hypothetical protein